MVRVRRSSADKYVRNMGHSSGPELNFSQGCGSKNGNEVRRIRLYTTLVQINGRRIAVVYAGSMAARGNYTSVKL